MSDKWMNVSQLAQVADVTERAASTALAKSVADSEFRWRGSKLLVEAVQGAQGRGGKSYRVLIASLPPQLKELINAPSTGAQLALPIPSKHPSNRSKERDWWHFTLHPALSHPKGSKEREAAIRTMTGTIVLDWKMRPKTLKRTTIYTKLQKLEATGSSSSLMRKERTDRGHARIAISRVWDGAVAFDDETKKVEHYRKCAAP